MIDFINVSKRYDNGTQALKDVNIHIEDGEFVFVVGASGAGKSRFFLKPNILQANGCFIVTDPSGTSCRGWADSLNLWDILSNALMYRI